MKFKMHVLYKDGFTSLALSFNGVNQAEIEFEGEEAIVEIPDASIERLTEKQLHQLKDYPNQDED